MQQGLSTGIDKEIIIGGVIYNECNGCSLYDGNICTGAKTYEANAERDRHICDEHLASQFWVVFNQLKRKEQELKKYEQVLNEIENYVLDNSDFDKSDKLASNTGAYDILEIINEVKEKNKWK
jgi:hypothetical protein